MTSPKPIHIPGFRTAGSNAREVWQARTNRVKKERKTTAGYLKFSKKPETPCSVVLVRMAPSNGLDDDNLRAALKGVRDEIANWLGVDDRDRYRVRYRYRQERAPWGVRIEFGPPVSGAQMEIGMSSAIDDDDEETPF